MEFFDSLIDKHAKYYMSQYEAINEFNAFELSGTNNFYIGMVHADDMQKIDAGSIKIRGSNSIANGKMIELDVSQVEDHFSFFPGQIVAVFAAALTSNKLPVKKILDPTRIMLPKKQLCVEKPINLIVACGPYFTKDEDFTLFDKLVATAVEKNATHVVLIGPFVDIDNDTISDFDQTFNKLFEKLQSGFHKSNCKIYLVPSQNDLTTHEMNSPFVYPRPKPCIKKYLAKSKPTDDTGTCSIQFVDDPSQIDIDGVLVDVTSADVLTHLKTSSTSINDPKCNTIIPLYKHILTQNIYPIYPNHSDTIVDYSMFADMIMKRTNSPHILIIPTRFLTSITNIENVLVSAINRCVTKKQIIIIQIPEISKDSEIYSLAECKYASEILDLV